MNPNATLEFGVDLTCGNCVKKTEGVLSGIQGISSFNVDLEKQSVVVETALPSEEIKSIIESTGKKAVLLGLGADLGNPGEAAVAMLGGVIGCGSQNVQGIVRFVQHSSGKCLIDGTIDGLAPGDHAIAIHESGDLSAGCGSVGDHYNPRGTRHGSPENDASERHVGDLGNVMADGSGRARFRFVDNLVNVADVIGRSFVIAEGKDDLGQGSKPLSLVRVI